MDTTYILLQNYWWFVISLLGALLVFLLFVQGGQSLLFSLGKNEIQQKMMLNSTGRKWEFTFTTLVTFGGAFFASFPLFYSTSFGGAYWVWIAILFCFVIQAVSYEYQSKKGNLLGKKTYQVFLMLNGIFGPVLLGTAVGTFFNGAEFTVNKMNLTDLGMPVISSWNNPLHGLEAVFVVWNVCLGLAVFFLARIQALLYFINNINDVEIGKRARKRLIPETALFLVFFLAFLIHTFVQDGFAINPETKEVFMQPYKYFTNLIEMPVLFVVLLVGVAGVLFGILKTIFAGSWKKGIWFSGVGTVLTVLVLFLCAGWNHTAYYPSVTDLQSSLTLENSSSSKFTLTVMSYVSILVPFVLWYIFYAWKALDLRKIDQKEMEEGAHTY
ncbi:MAG: cytochrome d ubiquinol oxidase subunit II [Massilibacteroides sp.]|nr:cytochrome d ubiquinol oxidase subunit II [Massilibacteroides sp.]MDD3062983.1 cytochrome d ubiquinol oxidase subunit II [Massilibacteroides sp.]MDD4116330.1 cytochrome d ubiquinol oxidase subunit II [Massilibacteroides sp.]MDD4660974.1 cytochrome d ubiquinol oxidase subunit II [Massilibacteroides sp.]